MRSLSGRELAGILERHGWTLLRVHGSHHIYGRPGSVVRLSVPVHANRALKTGLLRHLLKMAELSEADIEG
jgi:predicted RNA binding protein YcfA (HicA-like mRNA interferase family)